MPTDIAVSVGKKTIKTITNIVSHRGGKINDFIRIIASAFIVALAAFITALSK